MALSSSLKSARFLQPLLPPLILSLFFILSSNLYGKTKILVIGAVNGGAKVTVKESQLTRDTVNGIAYTLSQGQNSQVVTAGGDGKWIVRVKDNAPSENTSLSQGLVDSTTNGPARTLQDLKSSIEKLDLKPGESVVVYVTGFGKTSTQNRTPNDPTSAAIELDVETPNWKSVGETLRGAIPSGVKLKIAANLDGAGGVHELSRDFSNICSVASVPHFSLSLFDTTKRTRPFEDGFWKSWTEGLNTNDGNRTLGFCGLSGIASDGLNQDLGSLSSFDYLDFALKEGPYHPANSKLTGAALESPIHGPAGSFDVRGSIIGQRAPRWMEPVHRLPFPSQLPILCNPSPVTARAKGTLFPSLQATALLDKISLNLPNGIVWPKIFLEAAAVVKSERTQIEKILTKIFSGDTLNSSEMNFFEKIKIYRQILMKIPRVIGFIESPKTTPAQKKKFEDLLACEFEPL